VTRLWEVIPAVGRHWIARIADEKSFSNLYGTASCNFFSAPIAAWAFANAANLGDKRLGGQERTQLQTAEVALRLHRGDELYEASDD
jgi:hypothetical protein